MEAGELETPKEDDEIDENDKDKSELKPPPEDKYSFNPSNVTLMSNDIIKLTAQFVA